MAASEQKSKTTRKANRTIRGVRLDDAEWAELQRIAAGLGCRNLDGSPSVSGMIVEIATGSLAVVRARMPAPRSQAEIIRAAIAAYPLGTDAEIARLTGNPHGYVTRVRTRMGKGATKQEDN